jgi:hypothetical protein
MTQMVVNAHALESGSLAMTPSGHRVANLCLNLAVIHAYSVLEQTLRQLAAEDKFASATQGLESLMRASRDVLRWQDYATVDEGRKWRNAVAHEQQLLDRSQCWRYIDALNVELTAWGIL